jgi:hypothetical protein
MKIEEANPVNTQAMKYRNFFESLRNEARFHSTWFSVSFALRVLELCLAVLIFKLGMPAIVFDNKAYKASMRDHSDFFKFDDALRMVVDCSAEQADAIEKFLERRCAEGAIFYGISRSSHSLMTCYFSNPNDGGHIHFIDGGDGGYTNAARMMKSQIRRTTNLDLAATKRTSCFPAHEIVRRLFVRLPANRKQLLRQRAGYTGSNRI